MYNEKTKKMRYVLKIGQLTTTYDNFDDFVEAPVSYTHLTLPTT